MKDEVGVAFTITLPSVLRPMGSWWPNGTVFPPRRTLAISGYPGRNSRVPTGRGARLRPERHNPVSIASLRIRIAHFLLRQLARCPFCGVLRL